MQPFVNKISSLILIYVLSMQSAAANSVNFQISPVVAGFISNNYITQDGLKTIYGHGGLGIEGAVILENVSLGATVLGGRLSSIEVSYAGTKFSGPVHNDSLSFWFDYAFLNAKNYSLSVFYSESEHNALSNTLSGIRNGENITLNSESNTTEKQIGLRSRYSLNSYSNLGLGLYLKDWDFSANGDTLVGNLKVRKSISHGARDLGLEVGYSRNLNDHFDIELKLSNYALSFKTPTRSTGITLKTTYKF